MNPLCDAEWECQRLLLRVFHLLDEFDYRGLAALFTPDGLWERQGRLCHGPDEIVAALSERSPEQRVRHVITNVMVDILGDTASAIAYNTAYRHLGARADIGPAQIRAPLGLWISRVGYRKTPQGWRIALIRQEQQFAFE